MSRAPANPVWQLGVAYCIAALALDWVSNIGLYRGLGVTPWTPTSGLALAFAYIFGKAGWLPLLAAELLTLSITNKASFPFPWILILAICDTSIWIAGGRALHRMPEFEPRLGSVQAFLRLITVAVSQSIACSLLYAAVLWINGHIGPESYYPILWRLMVGHLVGVLVVSPLPLMVHAGWRLPRPTPMRAAQVATLMITLWVIFNYRAATAYQLFYLLFIPVLWVAIKDGIGGSAIMLNITQVGIIFGAQLRTELIPSTGALQILMITLALTGLLVGAVVTDRQAADQRLRDQHAAISRALRLRSAGETAAAISHQINQPITAISTYAAVVRDALDRSDQDLARTALAKLIEECERAAAVSKTIRDLVKQGSLSPSSTRVEEIIENVRHMHQAECAALDVALEVNVPPEHPMIYADKVQLEQALDNLVTNSIEAIHDSGRGSHIKISTGVEQSEIYLEVEDDGPGFAPGLDALATTPFMTTKHNGSGLGLAIARSVAEAHGGSLAIKHRNGGACVRLRLPTNGRTQ